MEALTQPKTEFSATFLAGFALECGLKAFLSYSGTSSDEELRRFGSHDLVKLWENAAEAGLFTDQQMRVAPQWCEQLAGLHALKATNGKFYYYPLRYPLAHGHAALDLGSIMRGLREVVAMVHRVMRL